MATVIAITGINMSLMKTVKVSSDKCWRILEKLIMPPRVTRATGVVADTMPDSGVITRDGIFIPRTEKSIPVATPITRGLVTIIFKRCLGSIFPSRVLSNTNTEITANKGITTDLQRSYNGLACCYDWPKT